MKNISAMTFDLLQVWYLWYSKRKPSPISVGIFPIWGKLPANCPLWQFTENLLIVLFSLLGIIELIHMICQTGNGLNSVYKVFTL